MLDLPEGLERAYSGVLDRQNVPQGHKVHFLRWLRYFLDFCQKHQVPENGVESLEPFLLRLAAKGQASFQVAQARQAVMLFQAMEVDTGRARPGSETSS